MDIHITFPKSHSPDAGLKDHEVRERSVSEQEPVVILLGWAGCNDRHLAKYSAIYETHCITIRYTAPNIDLYLTTSNLRHSAEKILRLIIDHKLESHPVFVHSFSNGGGLVYRWITESIHGKAEFKQIRLAGAIFDSCPGQRHIISSIRVLMTTISGPAILKYLLVFLFIIYVTVVRCVWLLRKPFWPSLSKSSYWYAMKNDPSTCPQLYLYSKTDIFISYLDVEEHVSVRKQRGVDVRTVCWDDSKHVMHFLKHRESYIGLCLDFVDSNSKIPGQPLLTHSYNKL